MSPLPPPILRGFSIDLPEDLIREEILLRLPVKSLLRFRSVCKSWHATISSLDFINNHYHHQTNNKQRHIIYRWRRVENKTKSCFSVFSSNLERLEKPDYLELPGRPYSIYGPCNSIFCIYFGGRWRDSRGKWLALWNPATRRLMPLPFAADRKDLNQLPRFMQVHRFAHGFGMDPFTHELKIVILDSDCNSGKFAMYKSSNKIPWMSKSSDKLCVEGYSLVDKCVVFVNGFIYWMRFGRNSLILAFDLHNEVFEVIQIPSTLQMSEAIRFDEKLMNSYDDSLAIFFYDEIDMCIVMWAMKEKGSWTKLPTLVLPSGILNSRTKLIFCVRNKILVSNKGELLVYDPHSQSLTSVDKIGEGDLVLPLMYYKESLASLKGDHELQDTDTMSDVSCKFFAQDTDLSDDDASDDTDSSDDDASDDSDSCDDESIWNTLRRWLF